MRRKLPPLALAIFGGDVLLYTAAFWGACHMRGAAAWVCGGVETAAIAMLFIVGHDACHGSFTDRLVWNRWIGVLAFLPSLTPYSAWEFGHNQTHHVYTNLKPIDRVWMPFSKREFDRLPRWRRALERIYRTPLGLGLYYAVEIWWKYLFFGRTAPDQPIRPRDLRHSLLCAAYAAALGFAARRYGAFLPAFAVPFVAWNWVMGFVIFLHHSHPDVPWFDDPAEWRAAQVQTRCTVHVILPWPCDWVLHRIMRHTAHHLDVTVPLYGLADAQRAIEGDPTAGIVVYRWTLRSFLRHLRACQLYDFERRCWVGFDGFPRVL